MIVIMIEQGVIWFSLVLFGLALGSFAGATVWRLRSKQLIEDLRDGDEVDAEELERLRPLSGLKATEDRSRCLRCGHVLAWYDLLPLVSWLGLRGRCRYCKAPIGPFEPIMELAVAGAFIVSYILWPGSLELWHEIVYFLLWLVAIVMLSVLFAYDFKWFILPDQIVFPLIGVGLVSSGLRVALSENMIATALGVLGAVLVLSGLYYALWLVSSGSWVGFGDVKLGLALGLLLGDWHLALVALFSANLIGSLLVIPGMLSGRVGRKSHVPFGPLLIAGAFVAMLVGERAIDVYLGVLF
jgi:leader peptidase (prepilin peptidase)/N-methyltransferase